MTSDTGLERESLRSLIEFVFERRNGLLTPITYSELASRIGRLNKHGDGHGHGMGFILGKMGHLLRGIEGDWGERIPHLQSLVVNKSGPLAGLPDEGIKEFWPSYPDLSHQEKLNKTRLEHVRITEFGSRWNDVLSALGLSPLVVSGSGSPGTPPHFGKGGESESHRRLKAYVLSHPELVQATDDWEGIDEYVLPTLDKIDVLFRSGDSCIAVEVKSSLSDLFPSDYERGLFQIVKYRALLAAMSGVSGYQIPSRINCLLVLESRLPAELRELAVSLNVTVLERIRVEVAG